MVRRLCLRGNPLELDKGLGYVVGMEKRLLQAVHLQGVRESTIAWVLNKWNLMGQGCLVPVQVIPRGV
uniref:Uncharacterized protein n=1 Tax=Arundo donax TaxID=35708 RepID=A0A0A9DMV3_ARUDO